MLSGGRLVWIATLICWASACTFGPSNSHTIEPKQRGSMNQARTELLEFLRRLKVAFDAGVGHDPKELQRIAGLRVLDWDESDPELPKIAETVELDLAALDRQITKNPDRPGLHYVLRWQGPGTFLLSLRHISQISCVPANEAQAIFGPMELKKLPRGLPTDGGEFSGKRWQVYSVNNGPGGALLTLSYDYTDERDPSPTCLATVAISAGVHQ